MCPYSLVTAVKRASALSSIIHVQATRQKASEFFFPGHGTDLILILTHLKEGTPSTEFDDLSTLLYKKERKPHREPDREQ